MQLELAVIPGRIARTLAIIALGLALISLVGEYLTTTVLPPDTSLTVVLLFDLWSVNAEESIPTWYSVMLLAGAAISAGVITLALRSRPGQPVRLWAGLALLLGYLSLDEGAVIHEIVADYITATYQPTGFLFFGWQVIAVPLVGLVGLVYLRFWQRLPARTRWLTLAAAAVYIGGALGIEGISANQLYLDASEITFTYLAIATLEELCEMLGVIGLIYALLDYLAQQSASLMLITSPAGTPAGIPPVPPVMVLPPPSARPGAALVVILVVVALVFAGIGLVILTPPALDLQADEQAAAALTDVNRRLLTLYTHLQESGPAGVLVVSLNGPFTGDDLAGRRLAASLLVRFPEVVVVSLSPAAPAFALVADQPLPDREALSRALRAAGATGFIIYEPAAVRAVVGDAQPLSDDPQQP